jgi:hypothetical protein
VLIAKPSQEDGLSNPGFAADEHQASSGAGEDGGEGRLKRRQEIGSLQQLI